MHSRLFTAYMLHVEPTWPAEAVTPRHRAEVLVHRQGGLFSRFARPRPFLTRFSCSSMLSNALPPEGEHISSATHPSQPLQPLEAAHELGLTPLPLPLLPPQHPSQLLILRTPLLKPLPRAPTIEESSLPLSLQPPFHFLQTMDPALFASGIRWIGACTCT